MRDDESDNDSLEGPRRFIEALAKHIGRMSPQEYQSYMDKKPEDPPLWHADDVESLPGSCGSPNSDKCYFCGETVSDKKSAASDCPKRVRGVKVYRGFRSRAGARVYVVESHDARPLRLRLDLRSLHPRGPDWGVEGNGSAQLAVALIADACGDDELTDPKVYQAYMRLVVEPMKAKDWVLTSAQVRNAVDRIKETIDAA